MTAAVVLLGLALVAIALAVRLTHSGQVLPGVEVEGVALGGASREDARRLLAPLAAEAAGAPVALVAEDRRVTLAPPEAGYAVDVDATVDAALEARRGGPLGGLGSTVAGLFGGRREVALVQTVDRRRLGAAVAAAAGRLGREHFPGEIVIEPGTLTITTKAPRSGREVDRAALVARLDEALRRRPRGRIDVPLHTIKVASRAAVDAVGRAARDYLSEPLRLTGAGEDTEIAPGELATVLALESFEGGRRVRLGAGDARLAALVERVAAERDRPARDAEVQAPARLVTFDDKGDASWRPRRADVTIATPARRGRVVRRKTLAAAIESAIRTGRHELAVPTERVEPAVSARAARAVDSLIGTFTTHYEPGQPRVRNIVRIARDVDGTLVAPGARFSLNAIAGERTEDKGYVEAPFIADGKIEPSIGGGVSQFSTTLYNAAYFAGLRIEGHRPHSFFIDRYPAGRESTLNFPDIDLTWINDTDAPVLIRTSTDADSVSVSLYGDNGGRRVSAESGEREPLADRDFSIVVTRIVRHADGRIVREPFTTRYDKPPPPDA